jgi:hypothetical protein
MIILHFLGQGSWNEYLIMLSLYGALLMMHSQICQVVSIIIKLLNLDSNNEIQNLELHF